MGQLSLEQQVRRAMTQALDEDRAHEDITSQACIDPSVHVTAEVILKQRARVAGLIFLPWILDAVGISSFQIYAQEGKEYDPGTVLATIDGNAQSILAIERSALNLIQHACGIATITARFVQQIEGCPCAILDTRKTLPGLRAIQKYAVQTGGGKNHRFDLKERFLIKNNHLSILCRTMKDPLYVEPRGFGAAEILIFESRSIYTAIHKARLHSAGIAIEVEVNTLEMLQEALDAKPDAILLDNMTPECVAEAVARTQGQVYLEASGGITLSNVRAYAKTGVGAVSIGALTHSAPAVDISLRI